MNGPTKALLALVVSLLSGGRAIAIAAALLLRGTAITPILAAPIATPSASPPTIACTVAPRSVDALVGFWFDPSGKPRATPTPAPQVSSAAQLPQGAPADPATVAGVTTTLQQISACLAANQLARAFALYSDDLIRQSGPDVRQPDQNTPAKVRALLTAQLATSPSAVVTGGVPPIVAPREVRRLPDGRVGALFADPGGVYFGVFVRQGDRWLLAQVIAVLPVPGFPATPTP